MDDKERRVPIVTPDGVRWSGKSKVNVSRHRSRSLDMAGSQGDSGQKRRGGRVFGSLERGLDKVITMLTPSKRRALRDGPRKIKVHMQVHI